MEATDYKNTIKSSYLTYLLYSEEDIYIFFDINTIQINVLYSLH